MSNLYVPPCPTDCGGSVAAVLFNDCAPETHWGEVSKVYIGPSDTPAFLDVTSLAQWTAALAQSGDDKIRTAIGIGEFAEPETTETPISGDRIAFGFKKFSLPYAIDETNDTNYNFFLQLECGGKVKIWFETSDGLLFGGNDGIEASVKAFYLIPRERSAMQTINLTFKWNSLLSPFRCTSPLY